MSNITDISDRFARVSSLYGPGTWAGWACTALSVIISWTFHTETCRKDTITNDYLAMLAVPAIAAGHILWLICHHDEVDLSQYASHTVTELETSDPVVNQYVAEVEAPLFLNTEFMLMVPYLAAMAAMRQHPRRLASCLSIQLFVFLAQFPIFLWSIDGRHWVMDLERLPLLLVGTRSMTVLWLTIGPLWILFLRLNWLAFSADMNISEPTELLDQGGEPNGFACRGHGQNKSYDTCEHCRSEARVMAWACRELHLFSFRATIAMLIALGLISSLFVFTVLCLDKSLSPNHIWELDQAVALLLGIATVLFSVRDAVKSHRGTRSGGMEALLRRRGLAAKILRHYGLGEVAHFRSRNFPASFFTKMKVFGGFLWRGNLQDRTEYEFTAWDRDVRDGDAREEMFRGRECRTGVSDLR